MILKGSNRLNVVTSANNGDILLLGPGGAASDAGTIEIQFQPDANFAGNFQVLGRIAGPWAATMPYLPIPYRRVNVLGVATDLGIIADLVVPAGIIRVPAGGLEVALLVTCSAGSCQIAMSDYAGSSAA